VGKRTREMDTQGEDADSEYRRACDHEEQAFNGRHRTYLRLRTPQSMNAHTRNVWMPAHSMNQVKGS
jgi:hypothetical protein